MAEVYDALRQFKHFEADIIAKALEDDAFHTRLLQDPKAAFKELSGKPMPEELKVRVLEEDPNTVTLVLPRKPELSNVTGELSDAALEQVAGGSGLEFGFVFTTVTTIGFFFAASTGPSGD